MGIQNPHRRHGYQGITAPEPYKEQPEPPPIQRQVHKYPGDSEMSWSAGLVAPCYNGKPPSECGIYMPKCPPVDAAGKQKRRPNNEARGYPGEHKAR